MKDQRKDVFWLRKPEGSQVRIAVSGWNPLQVEELKASYIEDGWELVHEGTISVPEISKWKEFYLENKFWIGMAFGITVGNILDFLFQTQ